ncbi:MAG: DUF2341 domain-containing protein [Methanobacteriota archaeon]
MRRWIMLFLVIFLSPSVSAQWWNSSWSYRIPMNVSNVGGENLTNYSINFHFDTASFISAGRMKSDCSDVRMVDGPNQLSFWVESGCNSTGTSIWVKIPNLVSNSTSQIFLYYSNPNASSQSSIQDSFFWGTSFESDEGFGFADGVGINGKDGWVSPSSHAGTVDQELSDTYARHGSLSLRIAGNLNSAERDLNIPANLVNVRMYTLVPLLGYNNQLEITTGNNGDLHNWYTTRIDYSPSDGHIIVTNGTTFIDVHTPPEEEVWNHINLTIDFNSKTHSGWIDGILRWKNFTFYKTNIESLNELSVLMNNYGIGYVDSIFIREFVLTEPAVSIGLSEGSQWTGIQLTNNWNLISLPIN